LKFISNFGDIEFYLPSLPINDLLSYAPGPCRKDLVFSASSSLYDVPKPYAGAYFLVYYSSCD
jgi:hypothetical protein